MTQFTSINPSNNQLTSLSLRGSHQTKIRASLLAILALGSCKPNNDSVFAANQQPVLPVKTNTAENEHSRVRAKHTQRILATRRYLSQMTIGVCKVEVLAAEPLHAADNTGHKSSLRTAVPLLIPLSKSLDGTANYITQDPDDSESYKITILLDAPLLAALATANDKNSQYFQFPVERLEAELINPQGRQIGTIKVPTSVNGASVELTLKTPSSFKDVVESNPGLEGYSLTFDITYPGVTKETAQASVVLSEEIILKIINNLLTEQKDSGESISLLSEDKTKNRIKQSIVRVITADGSDALRLLKDTIADQLTGKIYEFLMKRGDRIQIETLDNDQKRQEIHNYLIKTLNQAIVDSVSVKEAKLYLYQRDNSSQFQRIDTNKVQAGVAVSGGIAIGPVSAGSSWGLSTETSSDVRNALQERLKTQHGIETEVDSVSGFLKITGLSSLQLGEDNQKMLVEEISKIELITSIDEGHLQPITVKFPTTMEYRNTMIQLFPAGKEDKLFVAELIRLGTSPGSYAAAASTDGFDESVLRAPNANAPYEGIFSPQNLFTLLSNEDSSFQTTRISSSLALQEYPDVFWQTRILLYHASSGQQIELQIPHCGAPFSDKLPPNELVDPKQSLATGLKALGFGDIVINLEARALTSDPQAIEFINHNIQSIFQGCDDSRREMIRTVVAQVRRQALALNTCSNWLSYRIADNGKKESK